MLKNKKSAMRIFILLDMVLTIVRQLSKNVRRRIQRAFLAEPDKAPQRVAIAMASVLLLSIIVTYNVLYEREKRRQGREILFFIHRIDREFSF